MLAERLAEGAERLDHMVFHRSGSDLQSFSYFFMLDALFAAEEVNGLLTGRQLLDGPVKDLFRLFEGDVGLGVLWAGDSPVCISLRITSSWPFSGNR